MRSFLIQSFTGLSDYEDKGHKGAFKFGSALDVRRNRDTLKAGQGLTDDLAVGGNMNASVVDVAFDKEGNSYWGLTNGKILKRTSDGTWSLPYTDVEGDLRGIGVWGNDQGEQGIYWTTPTKIHRKPLPGNATWSVDLDANAGSPAQTYPKTNLTNTPNHLMKPVGGAFYINNGEAIAFIGYDESYTNNALQLLPDSLATVLLDDGLYGIIGANLSSDREESWLYTWDSIATSYNDRVQLPFKDINVLVKGEFVVVQFGSNGELYFVGDSGRLPIRSFSGGGQVGNSGADIDGGLVLLGAYGNTESRQSGVYTFGRKKKNADFILNLEYPLVCDSISAVKKAGSDRLIAYKSGSNYGVKKVDTSNKYTTATYESLDLKIPTTLGEVPVIDSISLDMVPLPAGCSVEVWRRVDKQESADGTTYAGVSTGLNDGWFQCSTAEGTGSFSTEGGVEAVFNVGDKAKILEIRVVLNCSGNSSPEILSIRAFFE